jgi:hypothetical protein
MRHSGPSALGQRTACCWGLLAVPRGLGSPVTHHALKSEGGPLTPAESRFNAAVMTWRNLFYLPAVLSLEPQFFVEKGAGIGNDTLILGPSKSRMIHGNQCDDCQQCREVPTCLLLLGIRRGASDQ